jgi:uncharacterized cupin superfamily protein
VPVRKGEEPLADGDSAAFPAAPEGAHELSNETADPVRYLMLSWR